MRLGGRLRLERFIGYDLDGVMRHNNKSKGTGDIHKEWRNREKLLELHKTDQLPPLYYITQPYMINFIDGALDAIKIFTELEVNQYVLTNQEAIGLGIMSLEDWHLVREVMDIKIGLADGNIDGWFWCPHFQDENCECRKPKPGMFHQLAQPDLDLSKMIFIGDNPGDMEAAHRAGCGKKIHIVLSGADEEFKHSEYQDTTASSLLDAVPEIIKWLYLGE